MTDLAQRVAQRYKLARLIWTKSGGWPSHEPPEYHSNEGHVLRKEGRKYVLVYPDGDKETLRRATFDEAERAIARHR